MTGNAAAQSPSSRRVGLVSLGCAKNLVDAEIMLGSLLRDGIEIVNDPALADALIINTCSFIDAAQEESVDAILESAGYRDQHRPDQAVIVSGCLPQRFREQLPTLLPEVDAFMGIDQVESVSRIVEEAITRRAARSAPESRPGARVRSRGKDERRRRMAPLQALKEMEAEAPPVGQHPVPESIPSPSSPAVTVHVRPNYIPQWDTPRFRLTPRHFAYVKIAEGCNHPCSFCIIPRMRGGHRSRAMEDIVNEARNLVRDGVKELNLISQDSTYYGMDLRPKHSRAIASPDRFQAATMALPPDVPTLCTLLRALNDIEGDFWIRLLYTHPAHWTDELIATMAATSKVARYVDMPLQHIHDEMLTRMRRETSSQYIRDLISRIRRGIPGIAVRTTFIVGFPGETQEHFDTLLSFIQGTRFERLGVFCYSQEDGTVAGRMSGQVPLKLRQQRREQAMAVQHEIAREHSASLLHREIKVLVEGKARGASTSDAALHSWEHGLIRNGDGAALPGRRAIQCVARGEADAPDIDGRVYIRAKLAPGAFARVRVVGNTDYDLIADLIEARSQ